MSSNCTGKFKTELDFHAGTRSYQKLYKFENIGYVEVPDDHLYNTYDYEYVNVVVSAECYGTIFFIRGTR